MDVTTTIYVNDVAIDGGNVPLPVRVTHGRSAIDVQPDSPTLEFEWWGESPPCVVGDRVRIGTEGGNAPASWRDPRVTWTDPSISWKGLPMAATAVGGPRLGQVWTRFVGRATAIVSTETLGDLVSWKITCVGYQARLGYRHIEMERPAESDIARVQAIAAKIGVTINIVGTQSLMLAIDHIDTDALSAIQEVCKATGGIFWQAVNGTFWYGTSNHRNLATKFILPASIILDGVEWTEDSSEIINDLHIIYPAPPLSPIPVTGQWNVAEDADTGIAPGPGNAKFNEGLSSATTMTISKTNAAGQDMKATLRQMKSGSTMKLIDASIPGQSSWYNVNDTALDNGAYFQIAIEYLDETEAGEPEPGLTDFYIENRVQEETNSILMKDAASVSKWGTRNLRVETIVLDEANANILGLLILARRSQPYWVMPGVLIPYEDVNDSQFAALQQLEVSTGVLVPINSSPSGTPAPTDEWAVEGFVEEWRQDGYWMQLALSDWARTSVSVIKSWQYVKDHLTWQQATAKTWLGQIVEA